MSRGVLRFVVFVSGAAIMTVELLGTRVLAPTMGNSIFVWGSLISSFMIAMSAGYWLGGLLADAFGGPRTLGLVVALAGCLTATGPLVAPSVLLFASGLGPRLGSLTAALLIFFAPALLLAMVSPLAIRIAFDRGSERVGSTAGSLYAVSTFGSIAGTIATAFWLIPAFRVNALIYSTGAVLFFTGITAATAGGVSLGKGRSQPSRAGIISLVLVVAIAVSVLVQIQADRSAQQRAAQDGRRVIYQKDSQYHRIAVVDDSGHRYLKFDNSFQTGIDLRDPFVSVFPYADYFHIALALKPDIKSVLVIGLGGGAAPKRMWRDYPNMRIDAVEIDPAVVDVAKKYFGWPEDPRVRVFVEDGRRYIATRQYKYDLIIIDAYYADALPFHLTTQEFFRLVKSRLEPGGIAAYNVIGSVEGESSRLFRAMYKTISTVWRDKYVFPIGIGKSRDPGGLRNIIVFATDLGPPREIIMSRISSQVEARVSVDGFSRFGADLYLTTIILDDVPVLTDDYAPTDTLLHIK